MNTKLKKLINEFGETKEKNNFLIVLSSLTDEKKNELINIVYEMADKKVLIGIDNKSILEIFNTPNNIYFTSFKKNLSCESKNTNLTINIDKIIIQVTGGSELTLHDLYELVQFQFKNIPDDTNVMIGCVIDENFKDNVVVNVLAKTK